MSQDARLRLYRDRIRPEWIDYNGHMNEAFYLLVFSRATDAFMAHIGMDPRDPAIKQVSLYTLETHVCYLREAGEGAEVEVATQLVEHDAKRARLFHDLRELGGDAVLATAEMMLLNVDMSGPRAAPFAPAVAGRLAAIAEAQADLPWPEQAGRGIGLRK